MKTFKFAFLFLALFSFVTACQDDDDMMTICTQAEWVGSYTGTVDCDGVVLDATATVTASGTDSIILAYTTIDTTGSATVTFDPLPFNGCELDATASGGGVTVTVDSDLNGNELTIDLTTTATTGTSSCRLVATRN